jgi:hypothetical protein
MPAVGRRERMGVAARRAAARERGRKRIRTRGGGGVVGSFFAKRQRAGKCKMITKSEFRLLGIGIFWNVGGFVKEKTDGIAVTEGPPGTRNGIMNDLKAVLAKKKKNTQRWRFAGRRMDAIGRTRI